MRIPVRKFQYSTLHLQRLVEQRREIRLDAPHRSVWTDSQVTVFLETILLGIPVPAIYLQETDQGTYNILDGYNRVEAILKFLQNQVTLESLPFLPVAERKCFQELEPGIKAQFEDYQLTFYILPKEVSEELVSELRRRFQGE